VCRKEKGIATWPIKVGAVTTQPGQKAKSPLERKDPTRDCQNLAIRLAQEGKGLARLENGWWEQQDAKRKEREGERIQKDGRGTKPDSY